MTILRHRISLDAFHQLVRDATHREVEQRLLAAGQAYATEQRVCVCVIVGRRLLGRMDPA